MKNYPIILSLIILTLFSRCKDEFTLPVPEKEEAIINNFTEILGKKVLINVAGTIVDLDGNPIANAKISVGNEHTITNANGFFQLYQVQSNINHTYIKVQKSGYFLGSRSFVPILQGVNHVIIALIPAKIIGEIDAEAGGKLTTDKVTIGLNSGFVTENGEIYKGKVKVAAYYLSPDDKLVLDKMPGGLVAADNNELELLQTFGMLAVSLFDNDDNPIQLSEGNIAELEMSIAPSQLASAPQELPLWYFNEDVGLWVKEGSAKKVNGSYVGSVKHFSFWNCDVRVPSCKIFGKLRDSKGRVLGNAKLTIVTKSVGERSCITSSDGSFSGIVPSDIELIVEVYLAGASKPVATETIGFFNNAINEVDITLSAALEDFVYVEGAIEDCGSKLVRNKYLKVNNDVIDLKNGEFGFYMRKNNNCQLNLPRLVASESSLTESIAFNVGGKDTALGTFNICDIKPDYSAEKLLGFHYLDFKFEFDNQLHSTTKAVLTSYLNTNGNRLNLKISELGDLNKNGISIELNVANFNGPGTYEIGGSENSYLQLTADEVRYKSFDKMKITVNSVGNKPEQITDIEFEGNVVIPNNQNDTKIRSISNGHLNFKIKH